MAKLKPDEKRVYLSFLRPDDLRLFAFMEKRAYECRWELSTFILASLQDAFKGQIEDDEVSAIAEEAARKVRDRQTALPEPPAIEPPPMPKPPPVPSLAVSMDDAYEQAVKQVEALNAQPMKRRGKGEPSPASLPATKPSKKG